MSTIEDRDLEAALTGAAGADPALSALVRDVRAQAPEMTPHFAARLNDRVAALPAQPSRWRAALAPRRLLPVLAVAAVLGAVVTAGVVLRDTGESQKLSGVLEASDEGAASDEGSSGSSAGGSVASPANRARRDAGPSPEASSGALAPNQFRTSPPSVPPGDPAVTRLGGPRKVQRDAELTLTTAPGDVQNVADEVVSVTQDVGGVIARSTVDVGGGGGSASFVLRIPTRRLDDALKQLSDLAHVGSLKQGSTDITGSFVSATDRLSDARAERRALLKALGRATTPNAIESLRQRIRFNRSEIGALKGELQAVKRRADLATVSLRVRGTGAAKGSEKEEGGAWTPGDAARDALRVLEVAAGVILIAAAVLVPVGLIALLAALAARFVRRRGREQALDATTT